MTHHLGPGSITFHSAESPWRVGSHYGIHVYEGERSVATFHDPADAQRAVSAVNGEQERTLRQEWSRGVSMEFPITPLNTPAAELLFDLCLSCLEWRRNCICFERGYN